MAAHPRGRRWRGLEQIPWLYDLVMVFAEHGLLRRWREWLVSGTHGRVLELGCGTGRDLPLYRADAPVVGVDVSFEPLRVARRRRPGALLVQASGEALPFRPGTFDCAVSGLVLCSVEDPVAALGEVRRVLADGGTLRMIEHVRARRRWLAWLQDVGQRPWTWLTGGCRPNRDTEAAVRAAGFRIEEDGRRESGVLRRFAATRR
jgi:ubiquinone/menaquinone biosynthesis C-methylase UbiE